MGGRIGEPIHIDAVLVPMTSDVKSVPINVQGTVQQTPTGFTGDKSGIATIIADITALREQTPLTDAACATDRCGERGIEGVEIETKMGGLAWSWEELIRLGLLPFQ